MLVNAKVNLPKYAAYSTVLLIMEFLLARNSAEFGAMLVVFGAACLNQWMLVTVVRALSQNAAFGTKARTGKVVFLSLGKVFLLVASLVYGVQIMGDRVIIPLLIYVLQIAVLYLSLNRRKSEN